MSASRMMDIRIEVIDTTHQIKDLVDWLILRHTAPIPYAPTMYIDLEGISLSREGSISIFTLFIDAATPTRRICLIDVHTLGAQAFASAGVKQKTLKDILQDSRIPKVFFDVRNDSDALFAHFGVALEGVEDVQLMESATRKTTASRKFLAGLSKCIEANVLGRSEIADWKLSKQKGERLYKPEQGGSYTVFNQRPLPEDIVSYCTGDVVFLPVLRNTFWAHQTSRWRDLVAEETRKRVTMSQRPDYEPHNRKKAMAPWTKKHNAFLNQ